MDGLGRLFKGNHISERVPRDLEVILLLSGPEGVEFRFANNPTTYWTYPKYVTVNAPRPAESPSASPALSPAPNSTLPTDLPSSLTSAANPVSMPTPTPVPKPSPTPPLASPPASSPTPKARIATTTEEKDEDTEPPPPLRRRHHRAKESDDEGVPEKYRVWHLVNGHLKWYDKRNLHEVWKALPVTATPLTAAPVGTTSPAPTPRAVPNQ